MTCVKQQFSSGDDLASQGTFGNIGTAQGRGSGAATDNLVERGQGAAKHPTMRRSAPTVKNHPAPNVKGAKGEKPQGLLPWFQPHCKQAAGEVLTHTSRQAGLPDPSTLPGRFREKQQ